MLAINFIQIKAIEDLNEFFINLLKRAAFTL